jgi:hypothetical protein
MAMPKNDKHKDYTRYAEHCLTMMTTIKDQDVRAINREMAAEWLKLADAVLHPLGGGVPKESQHHLRKGRAIQT